MAKAKFERTKPHVKIGSIGLVELGLSKLTAALTMSVALLGDAKSMKYEVLD